MKKSQEQRIVDYLVKKEEYDKDIILSVCKDDSLNLNSALVEKALEDKLPILERKQNSRLKEISRLERKFDLKDILAPAGIIYSAFLGTATIGAIGGAIYSLFTKDCSFWPAVGMGALIGVAVEPFVFFGLVIEGGKYCDY